MNTIARTLGGALGSQIAASVLTATVVVSTGLPAEGGFTVSFALAAGLLAVSVIVTLAIPGREVRGSEPSAVEAGVA